MDRKRVMFVSCVFLPTRREEYRPFVIRFSDGGELRGSVSNKYCYDRDGRRLNSPALGPVEIEGLVPGIFLGQDPSGEFRMYLPDGEVYLVDPGQVQDVRLAEGAANVPVQP